KKWRLINRLLHDLHTPHLTIARYPLNTGTLEGINNKIKLIKRMGYGYRDTDYFFIKDKSGFPRKAAMNHIFPTPGML
ncbi:transposase, partial [Vibrio campbellii]|uniref:transposase n=1 Tax=Vibrio campbellii TaxID=680 RepID=UPI001F3E526A